jgi:hypothetical protein
MDDTISLRPPRGHVGRVVIAGDLYLADPAVCHGRPPWHELADEIGAHDIAIVNMECALSESAVRIVKSGPALVSSPALATLARAGGFTVASLANNHVLDGGDQGLSDTLAACRAAGLTTVGAGMTLAEAEEPLVVEAEGVTVAVVAAAEHEFSIAGGDSPGAAPLDLWRLGWLVRSAAERADVVIAIVHGGAELAALPRPGLTHACRLLVDMGAAAVVCHHSHVPGGVEVYRDAPIVYSVGNLLFPTQTPQVPGWYRGYLAGLSVDRSGVTSIRLMPYAQDVQEAAVRALDPTDAEKFLGEVAALSATIADPLALEAAWRSFCEEQRRYALGVLLGLSRAERGLMRLGIWPWWRRRRSSLTAVYDLFTCESHRELMETLLQDELPTARRGQRPGSS